MHVLMKRLQGSLVLPRFSQPVFIEHLLCTKTPTQALVAENTVDTIRAHWSLYLSKAASCCGFLTSLLETEEATPGPHG